MSLRSDLGRVRGLGSAKTGSHHWWHQRLTAIAILPLATWFIVSLLGHMNDDFQATVNWISSPFVTVLLVALVASVFYHAKLGLQVVIEDYIDSEWQKITCLILVKFLVWLAGLSAAIAVLKIYLGT